MTQDEIIERGLAASSLLENETFQSVIKSLGIECFTAFTESKPSQKEAREDTYNLFRGLQAIEEELNHRVQQMAEAVRQLDAANAEEDFSDEDTSEDTIIIQGNTDQ